MMGIGGGADGLSYHAHKEVLNQNQLNRRDIEQFISQLDEEFRKIDATIDLEKSPYVSNSFGGKEVTRWPTIY
jgi:hypothetical protein